jgi:hypothetical protein
MPRRAKPSIEGELSKGFMTIKGKQVPVEERWIAHGELSFYAENPRIYSLVRGDGKEPSQDEILEKLQEMDHVKQLVQDIKSHGGLIDPVFVKDSSLEVIEGNSRLAAWRLLSSQDPIRWNKMKCVILPHDIEQSLISALLGQWHLKGKKEWLPYEQAGYLHRRHKKDGISIEALAAEVGLKRGRVTKAIDAFAFMEKHGDRERDHWSYYDEFIKSRKIGKAREKYPDLDRVVVTAIKDGDIMRAQDLRDSLPKVCQNERVLRRYIKKSVGFDEAVEEAVEQGGNSSHYAKLKNFRRWLADEENQGEVVTARGDLRKNLLFELDKIYAMAGRVLKKLRS